MRHIYTSLNRKRGGAGFGYALLVGLIGIVALAAIQQVGENVDDGFGGVAGQLGSAAGVEGGTGTNIAPHISGGSATTVPEGLIAGEALNTTLSAPTISDANNDDLVLTVTSGAVPGLSLALADANGGGSGNGLHLHVTGTAPSQGTYPISYQISDGRGGVAAATVSIVVSSGYRQVGSFDWGISTYTVFEAPDGINWTDARDFAASEGGFLASITSAAENSAVLNGVKDIGVVWTNPTPTRQMGPWVGGYKSGGSYEWDSAETFAYSNFASGEPNNTEGDEGYLHYLTKASGARQSTWNDLDNAGTWPDDTSYRVKGFVVEKLTGSNAQPVVAGTTPVDLGSFAASDSIALTLPGLTVSDVDGDSLSANITGSGFASLSPAITDSNGGGSSNGVAITLSGTVAGSIGSYSGTITVQDGRGGEASFDLAYQVVATYALEANFSYGGHSYRAYSAPAGITWTEARNYAQAIGGDLASITSEAENNAIAAQIASINALWSQPSSNRQVGPWIGGFRPSGGGVSTFAWVSGEGYSYSIFASGEPNDYNGNEPNLHYLTKDTASNRTNTWNDMPHSGIWPTSGTGRIVGFIVEIP